MTLWLHTLLVPCVYFGNTSPRMFHPGEPSCVHHCHFVTPDFKSGGDASAQTLSWNERVHPSFLPNPLTCVGNSWIQCDLLRNVMVEDCQSPVWQVCQLILSLCKLEPAPSADPPLSLAAMHQLAASLLTASLLHSAATVGTVVFWCVHTHNYIYTLFNEGLHRSALVRRLLVLHFGLLLSLASACQGATGLRRVVVRCPLL